MSMSPVEQAKSIVCQCQYQMTFIDCAVCEEFESEGPAAEEMLNRIVCSREQSSFQMCPERCDGSRTFRNRRQRVPDNWCNDAERL